MSQKVNLINGNFITLDDHCPSAETISIINGKINGVNALDHNSKSIDLPIRTNDSIILIKQALIALKDIYKKGCRYQKAGIIFSNLKNIEIYNKNLFSFVNNEEKREKLMKAIDYTNIKYGRHALSIAQAGLKKKWNVKRQYSSTINTTCFELLPSIRTS